MLTPIDGGVPLARRSRAFFLDRRCGNDTRRIHHRDQVQPGKTEAEIAIFVLTLGRRLLLAVLVRRARSVVITPHNQGDIPGMVPDFVHRRQHAAPVEEQGRDHEPACDAKGLHRS